jgi:hypothetical protein
MAINIDAAAFEARYANKTGAVAPPPPLQELYAPGTGRPPGKQGQIPTGQPIPEGTIIQQTVGRGQPAMMVVPPIANAGPQPQMAVVPPTNAGRTTIGTFVETQQQVAQPTLPKTSDEGQKVGILDLNASTPASSETPKRKLDLAQLILDHIHELGGEKSEEAQAFYNRTQPTLQNWCKNPGVIPLEAINKFMQHKPGVRSIILDELEPHFAANGDQGWTQSLPNRGKLSLMVCCPILERPTLPLMWVLLYLAKKYECGFDVQADTMITRSRNMLAHRFLKSNCTWSLWLDGDIAAPIDNPDWYKWITRAQMVPDEYMSYDVVKRIMSHGKAMVGGVYASRQNFGRLVMQPEINPRSHEDKLLCNEIRRGTARGLAAVDWLGFGCALVHREVFLEVQRRFPDLAPSAEYEPWRFFQPVASEGEDEAFSNRARALSIPLWLDTQLICGHIGAQIFLPEHTRPVMAI